MSVEGVGRRRGRPKRATVEGRALPPTCGETNGGRRRANPAFTAGGANCWMGWWKCAIPDLCADHDPATADDDRTLHGAACHGCLLVAETSCEARNLFLDRALIVDTMGQTGAGSF